MKPQKFVYEKELLQCLKLLDPTAFKIFFAMCTVAEPCEPDEKGLFKKATGPLGYDDIRQMTGLSYSAVSGKLHLMEDYGYIRREGHDSQGRTAKNSYKLRLS